MNKILIIDFCNYSDYQIGGHLTFAKNMLSAFGKDLSLVGISTDKNEPLGKWFTKTIDDVDYDYFALIRYNKTKTKHFIPDRLLSFVLLRIYKKDILSKSIKNVFIQRHEILPAVRNFGFKNVCYRFPGMESPLKISKYWFGNYLEDIFNKIFFSSFSDVKLILATGDEKAIHEMTERSRNKIKREDVVKFPTRINTDIFKPLDKALCRFELGISDPNKKIVITTGRLASVKGWKFMIDCFDRFRKKNKGSLFYFIGEGEDKAKINDYIEQKCLTGKIILAGKKSPDQIALYLNAADLFIMGSLKEGWSTSLSEAIACGVPACVTNFSSAGEIIKEGINGFVSETRDVETFASLMSRAVGLPRPVYNDNVTALSVINLRNDLLRNWKLL
ncbi:MAG: glycosyltransferase [Fibrobacter sp.]|nr:glycosyltransferase [Fibrobacter sp.]